MTPRRIGTTALLVLTVAALAATAWFLLRPRYRYVWGDGTALPDSVNVPGVEIYEPNFTPDGRALIYTHGAAGGGADLYMVAVDPDTGDLAGTPVPLDSVNTPDYDEVDGVLGADGNLYFYSDRPGGFGGYDLYSAPRLPDGTFGEAVNLGPEVNSSEYDYDPCISANGRFLYFSSNRHDPGMETNFDLLVSLRGEDGAWSAPKALTGVNSPDNEWEPTLSPDGHTLYFTSNREGSQGYDLYAASFTTNREWGAVAPLGDGVNTEHDELDPTVNPANGRLFFVRLERFSDGTQSVRIWNASLDAVPLGPILSLDQIPKRLVFLVASAIAALLLLWLLFLAWGRLTTLQKCVLVSLLLHAIAAWILSITSMKSEFDDLSKADSAFSVYSDPTSDLDPDSVLSSLFSDNAADTSAVSLQQPADVALASAPSEAPDLPDVPLTTADTAFQEWQTSESTSSESSDSHAAFLPQASTETIRLEAPTPETPTLPNLPAASPVLTGGESSPTTPDVPLPSAPSAQAPSITASQNLESEIKDLQSPSSHASFLPSTSEGPSLADSSAPSKGPSLAETTLPGLPAASSVLTGGESSPDTPAIALPTGPSAQAPSITASQDLKSEIGNLQSPSSHASFLPSSSEGPSLAISAPTTNKVSTVAATLGAGSYSFTVPDIGGSALGGNLPTPEEPAVREVANLSIAEAEAKRPPPHALFLSHMPLETGTDIAPPKKHKFAPTKP